MGSLVSRWRKKPSTVDLLEKVDKDIGYLERNKRTDIERQKRIIGSLILYSVVLYIIVAAIFYLYYMPSQWRSLILSTVPMLAFPLLVWLLKRFLHWYFVKRIHKNELALEELKEKKKQILDEVMEKETYKKAKEILERFAPDSKVQLTPSSPPHSPKSDNNQGAEVRQRNVARPPGNQARSLSPGGLSPPGRGALPQGAAVTPPVRGPSANGRHHATMSPAIGPPIGPPMPQPILPRDRTIVDRLIEYLVGDGPQNRYALICQHCQSHNGMALREEFEYISFRCCYCYAVNKSRKHKPTAPPLDSMEYSNEPRDSMQEPNEPRDSMQEPNELRDAVPDTNEQHDIDLPTHEVNSDVIAVAQTDNDEAMSIDDSNLAASTVDSTSQSATATHDTHNTIDK